MPSSASAAASSSASRFLARFSPPSWLLKNARQFAFLACVALFFIYAAFRQRYVFGVDSYGYYQLGWNIAHGTVYLHTPLPAAGQPSLIPFGFSLNYADRVVPNYPPGFPLLISIGHLLRMPMLVTPFLGVVSCAILYRLLRARASTSTAWLLVVAWAFMPLTVFGSTMMMSDLVATTTLLAALLAWRTQRIVATAWLLGLSFAVRPTNVLFMFPFMFEMRRDRASWKLLLHLVAPCALYALYNHLLYGAPWKTGYGNILADLRPQLFPSHAAFYLRMTPLLLSPVIPLLALVGLRPWTREKAFLVVWPVVFILFFANWAGGGIDRWWWVRFILPGLPAVYLLAADGLEALRSRIVRPALLAALIVALLAVPVYSIVYGVKQNDLWVRDTGAPNTEVARLVEKAVPPGSLIGTLELAASFSLYTSTVIPFVHVTPDSPELVEKALASGRHVYLLVEPWNTDNGTVLELFRRFQAREITRYDRLWQGLPLHELTPRPLQR